VDRCYFSSSHKAEAEYVELDVDNPTAQLSSPSNVAISPTAAPSQISTSKDNTSDTVNENGAVNGVNNSSTKLYVNVNDKSLSEDAIMSQPMSAPIVMATMAAKISTNSAVSQVQEDQLRLSNAEPTETLHQSQLSRPIPKNLVDNTYAKADMNKSHRVQKYEGILQTEERQLNPRYLIRPDHGHDDTSTPSYDDILRTGGRMAGGVDSTKGEEDTPSPDYDNDDDVDTTNMTQDVSNLT